MYNGCIRSMDLTWRDGSVPADWQKALIVLIRKKGSRTRCKNYCMQH